MSKSYTSMDFFRVLPKTNCKECNTSTCLAFSVMVFKGEKQPHDCPYLDDNIIEKFGGTIKSKVAAIPDPDETIDLLKKKLSMLDLKTAAERTGGVFSKEKLTLKIMGKDFSVDAKGQFSSDIHVNPWVAVTVLSYIINSAGIPLSDKWVPLRELKGGKTWYRLFGQRCEKPLKKIADTHTELFEYIMDIFNGTQVENHYDSDISLILYPLPKVPILICYWKPDDGLESDLNLFFDSTAEENLNIEAIYDLGAGLVLMFEKIVLKHGYI